MPGGFDVHPMAADAENEIERPAWADELNASSAARKQSRFIGASRRSSRGKLAAGKPGWM